MSPKAHFLTTSLYRGHGSDWSYIWPLTGRHVFFYSETPIEWIAAKYRYSFLSAGDRTLFYRGGLSRATRAFLRHLLGGHRSRYFSADFGFRRGSGLIAEDRRKLLQAFK